MSAVSLPTQPRVLVDALAPDVLSDSRVRDAVAVVGFALLTAAAAQISIPLGFTPVPLTGQTFAVLLAGGVLGANRGAASQLLYVAMGAVGLPFYAEGASGLRVEGAFIPTIGYLIGFIAAAYVVGLMAERRQDRNLLSSIPALFAGTFIIYAIGAPVLAWRLGIPLAADLEEASALKFGIAPFLIGDAIKAVVAGGLLPATWKLVNTDDAA